MHDANPIADIVSDNLRALIPERAVRAIAKKAEMHERTLHGYLAKEAAPTITFIEKLACALEMEPWQLLVPGVTSDIKWPELAKLVDDYVALRPPARSYVADVADDTTRRQKEPPDPDGLAASAVGSNSGR